MVHDTQNQMLTQNHKSKSQQLKALPHSTLAFFLPLVASSRHASSRQLLSYSPVPQHQEKKDRVKIASERRPASSGITQVPCSLQLLATQALPRALR